MRSTIAAATTSGKRRTICHNHFIADMTIMRDVRLRHNQTIVANLREHSAALRAAMNSDKFAYRTAPPDACFGRLAAVFQVLRCKADRNERIDMRVVANMRATINDAVRFEPHVVA